MITRRYSERREKVAQCSVGLGLCFTSRRQVECVRVRVRVMFHQQKTSRVVLEQSS